MNAQLNTDARIDQILTALRTTEPPAGLEQRIAARLAQARTQPTLPLPRPSFLTFVAARFYAAAAFTLLIALTTVAIVHHRSSVSTAPTDFNAPSDRVLQDHASNATHALETTELPMRPSTRPTTSALPAEAKSSQLPPSAQDPDQIALAETLAPSRPAPLQPLTAQEHLILAATRPGQPIQLAELDLARAPLLHAQAEARESARIDRFVKQSLAPLAVAEALSSTTDAHPQEAVTPPPSSTPSQN
jgi:hypothetical protein